jgi:hypothetical protein
VATPAVAICTASAGPSPVDQNRAGAALAVIAALFCAGQPSRSHSKSSSEVRTSTVTLCSRLLTVRPISTGLSAFADGAARGACGWQRAPGRCAHHQEFNVSVRGRSFGKIVLPTRSVSCGKLGTSQDFLPSVTFWASGSGASFAF